MSRLNWNLSSTSVLLIRIEVVGYLNGQFFYVQLVGEEVMYSRADGALYGVGTNFILDISNFDEQLRNISSSIKNTSNFDEQFF